MEMNKIMKDSIYNKIEKNINSKVTCSQNLIPMVKKVIFKDSSAVSTLSYKEACECLNYIIKNICEIDEATFSSLYSAAMLRNLRISNLVEQIVRNAPDSILIECAFERKRIIFASVWNEYYNTYFKPLTSYEIYCCRGDLKGGLMKAASSKLDKINDTTKNSYGDVVDSIVYKTLNSVFDKANLSFDARLDFLSMYKMLYRSKSTPIPGLFQVISNRECYESALDFYMLNSPADLQQQYLGEYLAIRRKSGLQPNPIINALAKSYAEEYDSELILHEDYKSELTLDF